MTAYYTPSYHSQPKQAPPRSHLRSQPSLFFFPLYLPPTPHSLAPTPPTPPPYVFHRPSRGRHDIPNPPPPPFSAVKFSSPPRRHTTTSHSEWARTFVRSLVRPSPHPQAKSQLIRGRGGVKVLDRARSRARRRRRRRWRGSRLREFPLSLLLLPLEGDDALELQRTRTQLERVRPGAFLFFHLLCPPRSLVSTGCTR